MTDKQIIIKDVDARVCKFFRNGICSSPINPKCKLCVEISEKMCYYKQLKRKEQECEELKEKVKKYGEINEQETKDYAELKAENEELKKIINEAKNSNLDLKSFLVGETVQNEYEQQLDQLKQTLIEIKEISEVEIECKTYEIENDCFNETRCKALNEHIDFIKQILQKIRKVNNDNK